MIAAWLFAGGAATAVLVVLGGRYRTDFRLPGTDSQRATDALVTHFAGYQGDRELLVVHAVHGSLLAPQPRAAITRLTERLRTLPDVAAVGDPLSRTTAQLSTDSQTAVTSLRFREATDAVPTASVRRVLDVVDRANGPVLAVGVSGQATENAEANAPSAAESVAILATVVVLLIAFGSAAAVAIALASAGVALAVGLAGMALLSHVVAIPTFATQVATTVGLGVGIDYALLVLARYRAATQQGLAPPAAAEAAIAASGRAVVFAGSTVIVAMFGLYTVPLPFVHGLAVGVSVVVVPTVVAATTLLPAVLGRLGAHLDRWRLPAMRTSELGSRSTWWANWSRRVQGRPFLAAGAALVLLTLLAAPALALRVGNAEASTDNANTPSHRAYAYATQAFGPGLTSAFTVVATPTGGQQAGTRAAVPAVRTALAGTPGVAGLGVTELSRDGQRFAVDVYPESAPNATQSTAVLQRLRGPVADALRHHGVTIDVGGSAAINVDLAHAVSHSMPYVLGAVIGISLLLLLVLFRSVIVPIKAGVMNLLSVAAAFGVVVAVFQWGWGLRLLGVDYRGPLEVFLPLLLFPVVFGLSMDYEVFLVSRIRQEWNRTGDNDTAITEGLATTGRIVTAGAAVMIVLFTSLVFADARTVKMFGLAMAVAIAVDALIVRGLLLPATMQLLGRYNWWLPQTLERRLPRFATKRKPTSPSSLERSRVGARPSAHATASGRRALGDEHEGQ